MLFDALHNRDDNQYKRVKSWQDVANVLL
ncbi:hypothetical protein LN737_13300 [Spirosoma sp. KNUC1025]|nr:hypothetical protein LN737_13300 [Spirosoma sp. KNUC1025]